MNRYWLCFEGAQTGDIGFPAWASMAPNAIGVQVEKYFAVVDAADKDSAWLYATASFDIRRKCFCSQTLANWMPCKDRFSEDKRIS